MGTGWSTSLEPPGNIIIIIHDLRVYSKSLVGFVVLTSHIVSFEHVDMISTVLEYPGCLRAVSSVGRAPDF